MPMLPGRRRRGPDNRPIPAHPYRDAALVYAGMGVVLVVVASLTGGQTLRAIVAALIFFVIATALNVRQSQAIADAVEESLAKKGVKPALTEGYSRGEWILLDYFDFIVHVFTPATRTFYDLERLWGDAKRIEVPAID